MGGEWYGLFWVNKVRFTFKQNIFKPVWSRFFFGSQTHKYAWFFFFTGSSLNFGFGGWYGCLIKMSVQSVQHLMLKFKNSVKIDNFLWLWIPANDLLHHLIATKENTAFSISLKKLNLIWKRTVDDRCLSGGSPVQSKHEWVRKKSQQHTRPYQDAKPAVGH